MDSVWKDKWIKALNSGEYKQGRMQLRKDDDTFCCLGVLCDIVMKEHPEVASWKEGTDLFSGIYCIFEGEDIKYNMLPESVRKFVGMHSISGSYEKYDKCGTIRGELWRDNDDFGKSFKEIAEIIEEVGYQL